MSRLLTPELERVFWAGLQSHASFPLAHEHLGQALQFLVAKRLEVKRVERDRGRLVGHRTLLRLGMRCHQDRRSTRSLASRVRAARPPEGRTNDCKVQLRHCVVACSRCSVTTDIAATSQAAKSAAARWTPSRRDSRGCGAYRSGADAAAEHFRVPAPSWSFLAPPS